MNDAPESSDSPAVIPPNPTSQGGDLLLLAVVLVVCGALIMFAGVGPIAATLLLLGVFSMMTVNAVMEERGADDPAVVRARRYEARMRYCLIPAVIIALVGALVGFYSALVLIPVLAGVVLMVRHLRTAEGRFTVRTFLRGASEKAPGYLDHQRTRSYAFILIAVSLYSFGGHFAWLSGRDTRFSLEAELAATQELLESLEKRMVDSYAASTPDEKIDFLDHLAAEQATGESPTMRVRALALVLAMEEDAALQARIIALLNSDTQLDLPAPPASGFAADERMQMIERVERWGAE